MSKKAFFFLILFILAVSGFFGWYFLLSDKATPTDTISETVTQDDLFPFGQNNTPNSQSSTGLNSYQSSTTTEVGEINELTGLPRLRQISTTPSVGIISYDTGSSTVIRYVERATGHIFETKSDDAQTRKISSVTIPKIYESLWSADGTKLILRYLKGDDEIKTFYATILTANTPEDALEGTFLPDNIKNISSLGSKIFYWSKTTTGSSGIVANMDGTGKTAVFNSSFSDWISRWSSPTSVTIYPRPSAQVASAAFILNPSTGAYTKVGTELNGLTALANDDGSYVLLSYSSGTSIKSAVYDVKNLSVEALGVGTLTDKCIWSKKEKNIVFCATPTTLISGTFPDDWYKGKVSFTDGVWKIDVVTGQTEEVFSPLFEVGRSMDITDLSLNQSETVLVFKNKKDQIVWRYELVD